MKVTIRKNAEGLLEVYIPKKDLEAVVLEVEKEGEWGGVFKLSNGMKIKVPPQEKEPRLPLTLEVKKVE